MRTKKEDSLNKRYLYKLSTGLISIPFQFVIALIIPRSLGPVAYGQFNFLTNTFSQIFGFFNSGTSIAYFTKLSSNLKSKEIITYYSRVVFVIVLMTSTLFALAGFINAVYANSFDDISIVPTFILTPLIYLGGVFYSMDLLPDFWASVSKLNPLVYVVNAFRYGVLGVSDVSLPFAFGMITLFTVIAFCFSMHLLNSGKRLRQ
mgnify:CR=1 FL=1